VARPAMRACGAMRCCDRSRGSRRRERRRRRCGPPVGGPSSPMAIPSHRRGGVAAAVAAVREGACPALTMTPGRCRRLLQGCPECHQRLDGPGRISARGAADDRGQLGTGCARASDAGARDLRGRDAGGAQAWRTDCWRDSRAWASPTRTMLLGPAVAVARNSSHLPLRRWSWFRRRRCRGSRARLFLTQQ